MKLDNFKIGDQIKVFFKTPAGFKTKPTPFEGMVISLRGAPGNKTFTVRKVTASKIAVERIFPLDSPTIEKISQIKHHRVRRAKLYYLRRK
ncbi:50S ribosomal protein L19 [Candidatus Curtissbacteria bacterium]|nr:50S ribosomal protein L19 [Candidatus Curtissbacteria bacterium]MBI2594463.1 50S ribosomal protein L19 [Candidatus Curtissbacteria bacterium]